MKYLRKMPRDRARAMRNELQEVAADIRGYSGDLVRLAGSPLYRLRVGQYRAILEVSDGEVLLLVLKIGPRGDVYK